MPKLHKGIISSFRWLIYQEKLWLLGKLFGISPKVFTKNLIAVAKK